MKARRYLTRPEVVKLIAAADRGRYGDRDTLLLEMMYRFGLRVSEAVGLDWADVDLEQSRLLVRRMKRGRSASLPLSPELKDRIQALKAPHERRGPLFTSERGKAMTRYNVNRIVREAARDAEIAINCTPHVLRHSCGFELADRGLDTRRIQEFLGHRSIHSTQVYCDLAANALADVYA